MRDIILFKLIIVVTTLFFSITIQAQDSILFNNEVINRIDHNNKRQGLWKTYSINDSIYLECEFKDDRVKGTIDIYKKDKLIIKFLNPNEEKRDFIVYMYNDTLQGYFDSNNLKPMITDSKGIEVDQKKKDWVWKNSQIMPMFYSGENGFKEYIKNYNLKLNNSKTGRVEIQFIVNTNGLLSVKKIVKKSNKTVNNAAKTIILNSPRWQPGFQRGKFVLTQFTVPININ